MTKATTLLFIRNETDHEYHLHNTKIPAHNRAVVKVCYDNNHSTEHCLKGHKTRKFKLNLNGLLYDLDSHLALECNHNYLPIGRSLGIGRGTIWSEPVVIPSFYITRRHLLIK